MKQVCIFCGSSLGARPAYSEAARLMGQALAERGLSLVYGGSRVGLMGTLADSVLAAGGSAIGVIPETLVDKEIAHTGLSDLRIVRSMHERKALMAELADAFIALPGGFGTWEELCEIITWGQLGLHRKPYGLLNVERYYDALLAFVRHAVQERFVRPQHGELVLVEERPDRLLDRLASYQPPLLSKWLDRDET